jgi:hypothetical protein
MGHRFARKKQMVRKKTTEKHPTFPILSVSKSRFFARGNERILKSEVFVNKKIPPLPVENPPNKRGIQGRHICLV